MVGADRHGGTGDDAVQDDEVGRGENPHLRDGVLGEVVEPPPAGLRVHLVRPDARFECVRVDVQENVEHVQRVVDEPLA